LRFVLSFSHRGSWLVLPSRRYVESQGLVMTTKTSITPFYYKRIGKSWTDSQGEPLNWSLMQQTHGQLTSSVSTGDNNTEFRQRIPALKSATTVMSGIKKTSSLSNDGYAYCKIYNTISKQFEYGALSGPLVDLTLINSQDPSNFVITSVQNEVIQDINSKIRQATKSLQGLVSLGEMGETVRMLNGLGKALFGRSEHYLRDLSKIARHLTPRNLARTVSEKWLEYRFGVRPLVSDIGAFVDACYQSRYGRPPHILIRSQRSSPQKNATTTSTRNEAAHVIVTTAEKQFNYGFRLYGCVGLSDNIIPPFRNEFGLTLDEFAPTLWELIPFSFLADYASNIGAIIDAYSLNKSQLRWLNSGELQEHTCVLTSTVRPGFNSARRLVDSVYHPSSPLKRTWRVVKRNISSAGSLIPSLEFRIPGSTTQWLNIGALAHLHADASSRLRGRLRL
jgi:hypothetical protein